MCVCAYVCVCVCGLTGAVLVVVAEVQVDCPAELQNVAPLVLVDDFVL